MQKKCFISILFLLNISLLFGQYRSTPNYYDNMWPFYNGYAMVSQNDKLGLIDANCKLVVPCIYDEVGTWDLSPYVFYGVLSVRIGKYWGAIDSTGKTVLPLEYDEVEPFWNNRTSIVSKNNLKGVVDTRGRFMVPIMYNDIGNLNGGLRFVTIGNKTGYIDSTGKQIIECKYEDGLDCDEELIPVRKSGLWGYINKHDSIVIPFQYDSCAGFNEGLAPVTKGGRTGFIDKKDNLIIPFMFSIGNYSFNYGFARVKIDGHAGMIDKKGKTIIPFNYDDAGWDRFEHPCFVIDAILPDSGQKWILYDSTGKAITNFNPDPISYFRANTFQISKNKKYSLINYTGHKVLPFDYDEYIWGEKDYNRFPIFRHGNLGYVDSTGKTVIPFIFDSTHYGSDFGFTDSLATIHYHGSLRVINLSGKFIDKLKGTQTVKLYYANGVLGTKGKLINYFKTGKWSTHYNNGKLKEIAYYKHGLLNGLNQMWDSSGNLFLSKVYRNDTVVQDSSIPYHFYYRHPVYKDTTFFSYGKIEFAGHRDTAMGFKYGKCIEGRFDSLGNYYYSIGKYIHDMPDGEWKYYNAKDSLLYTEKYDSGRIIYPNRVDTIYDFTGSINGIGQMKSNLKYGIWMDYSNGKIIRKSSYLSGCLNGPDTLYYANGNIRIVENYALTQYSSDTILHFINDSSELGSGIPFSELSGPYKTYYDNGVLKESGAYSVLKPVAIYPYSTRKLSSNFDTIHADTIAGNSIWQIKTGIWTTYYSNGQIESVGTYFPAQLNIEKVFVVSDTMGNSSMQESLDPFYFKDGHWKYFSEKGKLLSEEWYGKAKLVNKVEY